MLTTLCDKTVRDQKHISVAQRFGCALLLFPTIKLVLSQFLEPGVFICYCAAGSDCEILKRVSFGWEFWGKIECRLIFGKILYVIITELLYERLIQTTKHECKFYDHISKFLVTIIYESETRTATPSAWHVVRQFVFLCTWAPFVIYVAFNIIFSPRGLYLRAAISMRNYPTELHAQTQIHISVCSLPHISLLSASPICKHSLSDCVDQIYKDIWFWLPHVQNCFFFKHINQ